MTEAQEKNHTDRVDPSSRMPRGQLMRRSVTYTHQAGAAELTPLAPPEKNSRYFWVPPRIYVCVSVCVSVCECVCECVCVCVYVYEMLQ